MGVEILYHYCGIARELAMRPEWMVGRVIARPYTGSKKGEFRRTSDRHGYTLKPYGRTALDTLKETGLDVISIRKIKDIFDSEGITQAHKSKSSVHGMEQTIEVMEQGFHGLCFVNLINFDALWRRRRNLVDYGEELKRFDELLGIVLNKLREGDLLIITADHGSGPTCKGADHTKEMVPFLAYNPRMEGHGLLPASDTFTMIGATIADNFKVSMPKNTVGTSCLKQLK